MLCHIVLFKLKDTSAPSVQKAVDVLSGMRGKVPGMRSLLAGADVVHSDRSYDVALVCMFDDRAALDAYQDHPAHQPVRAHMRQVRESSYTCDFDVE